MTTNLELAGKVARHTQLDSILLRTANIATGIEPDTLPEEIEIDMQYRTSMERRSKNGDDGRSVVLVTVDFKFNAKSKDEVDPIDVMSLDAAYLLVYEINPAAEIEDFCYKHFSEINGPYNAWPYWRELVQSVSCRLGLPALTVPVFRPTPIEVPDEELN